MSTTTTQTPPAFRGYWRPRPGARWTELSAGATYDAAMDGLMQALTSVRGGDFIVSRADPNAPPRRYAGGGRRLL